MSKTLAVYLDQDGVLADFERARRELMGVNSPNLNKRRDLLSASDKKLKEFLYQAIKENPKFYYNLLPLADAMELVSTMHPFGPVILTAVPSAFENCPEEFSIIEAAKWSWLQELFDFTVKADFLCTLSRNKSSYIGYIEGDVQLLIDDREENCTDWELSGGIAIQHVNTVETLQQFERLRKDYNGFTVSPNR